MMRTWNRAVVTFAVGLMLIVPAAGCAGRPAPRPETGSAAAGINPALSASVTSTATGVGGAGVVEAVVLGDTALVALQLNSDPPGGAHGGPLVGKTHDVGYPGSSASGGPVYVQGPGGSVGASPARPGGAISPGGAAPGGTPNYTQAAPNGYGTLATQNGTTASPAPAPGSVGSTPLDVMTRVADQIRTQHPAIKEVRFATDPADARRVADIARSVKTGAAAGTAADDVRALLARSVPAGT
ncbi:MAG TPA: hypothetical protein VD902_14165, partial [Symbiobacteriaceae bacterium]|nr:hypothetical protein [Symbiobacteriaceae bacterium]